MHILKGFNRFESVKHSYGASWNAWDISTPLFPVLRVFCGNGGSEQKDIRSILRIHTDCTDRDLADKINEAFVGVMQEYNPLSDDALVLCEDDEPISVTVDSVATRLSKISTSRAGGPDDLPNWVLKKFSDILAPALTEVLNQSFRESKVPRIWKLADVPPVPKRARLY